MKTVFFIRHAKSSWEDPSLKDIDRPLNKRGLRDAPFMAKVLRGKGALVDQFISSSANRAYTTATFFAKEFDVPTTEIRTEAVIYHAYAEEVLHLIRTLDDTLNTICIFGHNPTFTSIANTFTEEYIANVPTCGIIKIQANIEHWKDFDKTKAALHGFYYPKQYF